MSPALERRRLLPDLVWNGQAFEAGIAVTLGEDGRIEAVEARGDASPAGTRDQPMPGRALLPGFINVHSHAFQRGLRGHGETFPRGAGSFWTWREAMYGLVERLDAESFSQLCRQAFGEMLEAGITSVGEFHYFHHLGERFEADDLVLQAARETGIRIVLLQCCYRFGGIGKPLAGGQKRFDTFDLATFRDQLDRLETLIDGTLQQLGVVAHSIRAVDLDDLWRLHDEASQRDCVFHMHVEEQRQEIAECVKAHGKTPMALVLGHCRVDARTTAVHCTHTKADDMAAFLRAGGNVCLCPLTEGNLGDGIADLTQVIGAPASQFCFGSDSNARISMLEEMRWVEYVQRLAGERRGVVLDRQGHVGRRLLAAATVGGARSLGLDSGRIVAGALADLVSIDLGHPSLAFADAETLDDAIVFGAADGAIAGVCVGGRWLRGGP